MFDSRKDKSQEEQKKGALFDLIEKQREQDPFIGAKIGSQDVYQTLINGMKEPGGRLNCTILLVYAGALAGYSCQAATWEKYVKGLKMPIDSVFTVVNMKNGKNYYFGNILDQYVLNNNYSVVALASGMFHHLYEDLPIPDVVPIFERVTKAIGDPDYKIYGQAPSEIVVGETGLIWSKLQPKIISYCKTSDEWPVLFGLVLQKAMEISKGTMSPDECINKALESAIYVSRVQIFK